MILFIVNKAHQVSLKSADSRGHGNAAGLCVSEIEGVMHTGKGFGVNLVKCADIAVLRHMHNTESKDRIEAASVSFTVSAEGML
jgi:hypothetical protein